MDDGNANARVITTSELAKLLRVSVQQVQALGRLPDCPALNVSVRNGTRRLRWPMPESITWFHNRSASSTIPMVRPAPPRIGMSTADMLKLAAQKREAEKAKRKAQHAR